MYQPEYPETIRAGTHDDTEDEGHDERNAHQDERQVHEASFAADRLKVAFDVVVQQDEQRLA